MRIIDCHCHAGPGDGLTGPWDTEAPLGEFLKWSGSAGIQQTVLFAAFHTDYRIANRIVGEIVRRGRGRFFGFAFVHPDRDRGRIGALVLETIRDFGFCGIKVHRHDGRITREICEVARRFRLPVLYDVMGEISTVELLATQYRDVNFIIPHLGSFADDWRAQQAFLDPLSRHPNIFTDTSGVRRFDVLQEAYRRAGPRKILFGSDGPWLHPGVELAKITALRPSPVDRSWILAGNWLRLTAAARHRRSGDISKVSRSPTALRTSVPIAARDPWTPTESEVVIPL